jgi:hypothetical protein
LDKQKTYPIFNSPRGVHNPYGPTESEGKIIQLFSDALVHNATESGIAIVLFYSVCSSVLKVGATNFCTRYILLRKYDGTMWGGTNLTHNSRLARCSCELNFRIQMLALLNTLRTGYLNRLYAYKRKSASPVAEQLLVSRVHPLRQDLK